jgi:sigma-B regulation protein RsbU (phosphoserine phosphatase)
MSNILEEGRAEYQLSLKDRALAASAEGITIADATRPDYPLIYVNEGFEKLTGYSAHSVRGRNCRFLQGEGTDPAAAEEIRRAIKEKRECVVEILNYRKNGEPFWNRLSITPVRDDAGDVTHFIGIQSDVTARKNAEEALRRAKNELEAANRRIKRDLEMAAGIQRGFLPPEDPGIRGAKIAWHLLPCDELAGDTLGVVPLDDRYLEFYVIDVSGHGLPAALLSVTLNHWLSPTADRLGLFAGARGSALRNGVPSPAEVADKLNKQFPFDSKTGQYFTLIYGLLDTKTREFRFVTAGHPLPIHVPRDGEPVVQPSDGFPIGIVPTPRYQEKIVKLKAGDRIYLYSDGLIDAVNTGQEPLGLDRLRRALSSTRGGSIQDSVSGLIRQVKNWSEGTRIEDDVSVLAFEVE